VDINPLVPPLLAFAVSFFTSMAGVSGAFLLLPFQVSVLGYAAPSASATNHLFNVVATPGGIYRYIKEGRMLWPLAAALICGGLPGVLIGAWLRIEYFPGSREFRLFAGCVLLYIGLTFLLEALRTAPEPALGDGIDQITSLDCGLSRVSFRFGRERFFFKPYIMLLVSFLVGIVGGVYGVGGGVIIVPFLIAYARLPIHVLAGAALLGTFVASAASVAAYLALAPFYPQIPVGPSWKLGLLFGLGGLVGTWLGGSCQKYVSPRRIKLILCFAVLVVATRYVIGFWM
jgi:uncharacterized membrane protein YfcA